ncbi:hypothetical protein I4U23_008266 [Adineta vaga]|nr:hypothetical protein I4U23_008266 [Adineta vaga]
MNQHSISIFSTSYLRMYIVVFVLIICMNHHYVFANDNSNEMSSENDNQEEAFVLKNAIPDDIQFTRRGVWSRLFRQEHNPTRTNNRIHYSPTAAAHTLHTGKIHIIPFDKRTIPVELQKALYAHGIVGRR